MPFATSFISLNWYAWGEEHHSQWCTVPRTYGVILCITHSALGYQSSMFVSRPSNSCSISLIGECSPIDISAWDQTLCKYSIAAKKGSFYLAKVSRLLYNIIQSLSATPSFLRSILSYHMVVRSKSSLFRYLCKEALRSDQIATY